MFFFFLMVVPMARGLSLTNMVYYLWVGLFILGLWVVLYGFIYGCYFCPNWF